MTQEDGETRSDSIAGLPTAAAVEVVVAGDDERDPDAVRTTLDRVAEDGVVSRAAVQAELARVSKVVSTPETRVELAAMELSDARTAAEHVADLGVVEARLDAFESRLASVEDRVSDLGSDLQTLVDRSDDPGAVYETARGIRRLTTEANEVHRSADELIVDIEEFERWVANPGVRVQELDEEVDALADALDDLADVTAGLDGTPDAATAWLDAALRRRVVGLLLADLRAELADLRTWADRGDGELDEEVDALDDLAERLAASTERLDDRARPTWRTRFEDRLAAFETALDDHEPPVDWSAVQAALASHRPVDRDGA